MTLEQIWQGIWEMELSAPALTALVVATFFGCLVLPGHLSARYAAWFRAHPLRRLIHIGLSGAAAILATILLR